MKLSTAVLAFPLLAVAAPSEYTNAVKCGRKNPHINTAIQNFCKNGHIMVHSEYARNGLNVADAHVAIHGYCNPAQWVPDNFRVSQFEHICATNEHGHGHKRYGHNGCQKFIISKHT